MMSNYFVGILSAALLLLMASPVYSQTDTSAAGVFNTEEFEKRIGPMRWTEPENLPQLLEEGKQAALKLVGQGNRVDAVRALSAVIRMHRSPVDALYETANSLSPEQRASIWHDTPYFILDDFDGQFPRSLEIIGKNAGRSLEASTAEGNSSNGKAAQATLGASDTDADCLVGIQIPGFALPWRPFAVRCLLRSDAEGEVRLLLRAFEDKSKRSQELQLDVKQQDEIWKSADSSTGGYEVMSRFQDGSPMPLDDITIISSIAVSIPPGRECQVGLDEIIVYLPKDWESVVKTDSAEATPADRMRQAKLETTVAPTDSASPDDMAEAMEALEAIGYLGGTSVEAATRPSGVTVNLEEAFPGQTLYTSGHAPNANLIAMDGTVLHSWNGDYEALWEGGMAPKGVNLQGSWRRVRLLPGGDLLAIHEGRALIKIDKDSNPIWANIGGYHHDFQVMEDGRIYVLFREAKVIPRINPRKPILEDFVMVLDKDGRELSRTSMLEAIERSSYAPILGRTSFEGDIFHTNSVEVLDGSLEDRLPAFKAGNLLVSFRYTNTVGVVDPELGKFVWALSDQWIWQHDPVITKKGTMLIYDNLGIPFGQLDGQDFSRVIEIDPVTQQVVWSFSGSEATPFFSKTSGANQRFPNGNTLITETDNGRTFEVNVDGKIVWEFLNPNKTGDDGSRVAAIFEAYRVEPAVTMNWLKTP